MKFSLWNILLTPPTGTQREGVWPVTSQIIRMSRKTQVQDDELWGFHGLFKESAPPRSGLPISFLFYLRENPSDQRQHFHLAVTKIQPQERRHSQCSSTEILKHVTGEIRPHGCRTVEMTACLFPSAPNNIQGLTFKVSEQPPPEECQVYWSVNQQRVCRARMTVHVVWPPQCRRRVTSPWQPTSQTHDYVHMF